MVKLAWCKNNRPGHEYILQGSTLYGENLVWTLIVGVWAKVRINGILAGILTIYDFKF